MGWLLSRMVRLFHHLYFTCFFPNVLYPTHVAVYIQGDYVLEVVKWKGVVEVVNNIAPFYFDVKDVIPDQLLHSFGFLSMVNDFDLTIIFIQNIL